MSRSARGRATQLGLAAILALSSIPAAPPQTVAADEPWPYGSFLYRVGNQLYLEGEPFWFSGFNLYYANNTRPDGCSNLNLHEGSQLADALADMGPGVNVLRAWFFQSLAQTDLSHDGGVRDWSTFDHTLEVAAARGMKVIVTLTDQWGECGDGGINGYKDAEWYRTGYREVDTGNLVSYRDWVEEVVTRYRDDPRIAFWQLINEGEVKEHRDAACLPGENESYHVLKAWATDVANLVKSLDPNHLVSLGTMGGGQCGAQFWEYKELHAIPAIDLCEYHDYSAGATMPGDQWNGLAFRIQQCRELDKPLFVGEVGINPIDVGGTLERRATALDDKLRVQRAAGISGHVVWAWSVHGSSTVIYDIGIGDPVIDVLPHAPSTSTELISVASDGTQGDEDSGNLVRGHDISGDGRFVAFTGYSTTLVPGSTGTLDTFIRDRATGTTEFAISATDGGRPDSWVSGPVALSATGRFVVVKSAATNLVAGDTNGLPDIFVRDRITGAVALVTVATDGAQMTGDGPGHGVDISADGRYVVFDSQGAGLVPGVGPGYSHAYLRDRDTDGDGIFDEPDAVSTTLLSATATGAPANGPTSAPTISANGRYVAMYSEASDLVANDAPMCPDPTPEPTPELTPEPTLDAETPQPSPTPPPTESPAPSMVNCPDVFLLDRDADANGTLDDPGGTSLTLESRTANDEQLSGISLSPTVADTGWLSWAFLPSWEPPGAPFAFVRDPVAERTYTAGDSISNNPVFAADGTVVAFDSRTANGVADDTNGHVDAFVHSTSALHARRASVATDGSELSIGGTLPVPDRRGRFVAFSSHSPDAVAGDVNGRMDIFVRDLADSQIPLGATDAGSNVSSSPTDPVTGTSPVHVTFTSVEAPGVTSVVSSTDGADAPDGFTFGDPATYYDVSTTATYSGPITLCFTYDEALVDETTLALFHHEGGAWVNVTTSVDTEANEVCGSVTSLSPFALGWDVGAPHLEGIAETVHLPSYDHAIVVFSEPLDAFSIPEPTDFSITVNGGAPFHPTGARIAFQGFVGSELIDADGFSFFELDLPSPVLNTDQTLVTYTPGTRPIRDVDGNAAPGFVDQPIEYLDGAGPLVAFMDESTGPDHVLFAFLDPVLEPLPDPADFTIKINGVAQQPLSATIARPGYGIGVLDLELGAPASAGDTVTLSYVPGPTPLQTLTGHVVGTITDEPVHLSLATTSSRETPAGTDVEVAPTDSRSGTQPVTMTFENVLEPGTTTLETSQEAPELPAGFALGEPPTYFDIETTAVFEGAITICISFAAFEYDDPGDLQLMHFDDAIGSWVDVTTSVDTVAEQICGSVTSLSPFAIVESSYEFAGFFAPVRNPPDVNRIGAGSFVPIRFSLGGDMGREIFAAGHPAFQLVDCATGDATGALVPAATDGLQYLRWIDQYVLLWKTDPAWRGTCGELVVRFLDGTERTLSFSFAGRPAGN